MTPPLDQIGVGAVPNDETGDPHRTAYIKTNTAIASLDALQSAVGVSEGATTIGDTDETAGPSAADDSLLDRVRKIGGRAAALEAGGGGSGGGDYTLLAQDLDLTTITTTTRGTTYISDAGSPVAALYPLQAVGIWIVEARPSSAVAGTGYAAAAAVVHITVARESDTGQARIFSAVLDEGVLSEWIDASGTSFSLLTQDEREATHFQGNTDGDWRNLLKAGFYNIDITAGGGTNAIYPYVPYSGTLNYQIQVERTTDTTGVVTARVMHGTRSGGLIAPMEYRAKVHIADVADTAWLTEPVIWQQVGGTSQVSASRSVGTAYAKHELWLKWGQSNATGADGTNDTEGQGAFDPHGVDTPDPRVLEVSHGPGSRGDINSAPLYETQILRYPASDDSGGVSFAQTFGKQRCDMHPGIERLCISNRAIGGTGLVNDVWDPTTDPVGTAWSAAITEAAEFLDRNPEYVFAGILWHQGEQDATSGVSRADYENRLGLLIDAARARLRGGGSAVFICGTMLKGWIDVEGQPGATAIDEAHRNIATLRERCACVDFDDLTRERNFIHFGRDDLRTMGRRYAVQADTMVDLSASAGIAPHRFKWDGRQFSNILNGYGEIWGQKFTDDGTRGMVLDTNPAAAGALPFELDAPISGTAYTIAMHIKPRSTGSTSSFFSGGANLAGEAHWFTMGVIGHGNYSDITTAGTSGLGASLTNDVWAHIAITYDGTQFITYVDGVAQGSPQTNSAGPLDAPSSGKIGGGTTAGFTTDGLFDDFVLLPYAMSAAAIAVLAAE